jgi:hypothetical protein
MTISVEAIAEAIGASVPNAADSRMSLNAGGTLKNCRTSLTMVLRRWSRLVYNEESIAREQCRELREVAFARAVSQ